jgi:hypothetical protein
MVANDLAEQLRTIEASRLRALVERDLVLADRLHADDYQLVTPRGATLSKAEYLGAIAAGDLIYRRFEATSDVQVLVGADALAVLRYQTTIEVESPGNVFSAICWHTDCYRNGASGWQAVWSQATAIQ